MDENKNLTKRYVFACSEKHRRKALEKRIKPEHFRSFIENFGVTNNGNKINSNEWKKLKTILKQSPSLNIVGGVGSGKTFVTKELIKKDKDHIYIVLDAHNEYTDLPVVNNITTDLKNNCRIKLPDQPEGAVGMFKVYYNLIMNNTFPSNFILVVDEALRYRDFGIKNLMAESRKFLKVLAISQEEISKSNVSEDYNLCPILYIEPYYKLAKT